MSEILTEESNAPAPDAEQVVAPEPAAEPQASPPDPLEGQSEEFVAGYREALEALGYHEPPQPGDEGYAEHVRAEGERLAAENRELVDQLAQLSGVSAEQISAHFEQQWREREQAIMDRYQVEFDQHAEADRLARERVERTAEELNAAVDVDHVLEIARAAHADIAQKYGPEVARELSTQILEAATGSVSQWVDAQLDTVYELVREPLRQLNPDADPDEAVSIAADVLAKMRLRHPGDEQAAFKAAVKYGIEAAAGGFRPINGGVAAYHAALRSAFPDAPPPSPVHEVKFDRDPTTGRFTMKPLAEKYAAKAESAKSVFPGRQQVSDRAYEIFGPGNGPGDR